MAQDKVSDGKQDTRADGAVSSNVYADREDFGNTLRVAAGGNRNDADAMRAFDGPGGGPVIVDTCQDRNGDGRNSVTSTVEQNGRVVRERMECGPDMVVAYDDQGKAHRFPDEKITALPVDFSSIPDWRLKQMNQDATQLIRNYFTEKTPTGGPDLSLSFHNISDIMKDISKMDQYTEVEKCRLWSEVRNIMQDRSLNVLDADEKKEMIDSWKGSGDPWHSLITLNDGYHANRLINMSPEDASKAIRDHEEGAETKDMPWYRAAMWNTAHFFLGTNTGDVNASEGQLHALRALRNGGTFAAYADEWTRQFVRTDVDQWGFPVRK